jgi:hypothetical protein
MTDKNSGKLIRVLTCGDLTEAYLIKGRLNNEGIDCILTNENFTNLLPLFNNRLGAGIQILVNENDLIAAREILIDKISPVTEIPKCPHCGSENIALGLGNKKGLKIANILISIAVFLPMGSLKPDYYCKDCKQKIQ